MMGIGVFFLLNLLSILLQTNARESNLDEIHDLPGLEHEINFRHYSGYLNSSNGKFLYYWFVESQNNPVKDPLILWLNGGPGCSSLMGLLQEVGPFQVKPDGKTLERNSFSWNKIANMLFLEAPAGVGFSYSENREYSTDDDVTSLDNYLAMQHFFKKFPQFSKNDFYIMGESYGGIYIPTLAVRVLNDSTINFKGFAIGNANVDKRKLLDSSLFYARYHGLVENRVWESLVTKCCNGCATLNSCKFNENRELECLNTVKDAVISIFTSGINIYNIYADCPNAKSTNTSAFLFNNDLADLDSRNVPFSSDVLDLVYKLFPTPPCIDTKKETVWLNQQSVRAALHIPSHVPRWTSCSATVSTGYKMIYRSVETQFLKLLNSGQVRALLYNGDADLICNFLGDEWFADDLGLQVIKKQEPWKYNDQTAGFVKYYKNLTFLTVKGAGHFVPTDAPGPAYKMIASFLLDTSY